MSNTILNRIPYITLWAKKFDETTKFYKEKLGLSISYEGENFVQFETAGCKLYIHKIKTDATKLRDHSVEIHFEVDDVDIAYVDLKNKGVVFDDKPKNMPWGSRMVSCRDPEGYVVEVVGPLKDNEPIEEHS